MKTVCLDPGHGGDDPGAVGRSGLKESDMALDVCQMARDLLEPYVKVVMTRDIDKYVTLRGRAKISNDVRADCFASYHFNAAGSSSANGWECFTFYGTSKADRLAELVAGHHAEQFPSQRARGLKEASFSVLRNTRAPAILFEGAFITNPVEEQLIYSEDNRRKMAQALADGIIDFLGIIKPPTRPTPTLTIEDRVSRLEAHLGLA